MRLFFLALLLLAGVLHPWPALAATPAYTRVLVDPMKTSIYVGSVTLTPTVLELKEGNTFTATYGANVRPWFFWNETGALEISISLDELTRLKVRERLEFTGNAANEKKKPRTITGYAEARDATTGKIKVRILADGLELIFNGSYQLLP